MTRSIASQFSPAVAAPVVSGFIRFVAAAFRGASLPRIGSHLARDAGLDGTDAELPYADWTGALDLVARDMMRRAF